MLKRYAAITHFVKNLDTEGGFPQYQKVYQIFYMYWELPKIPSKTETPDELMANLLRVFILKLLTKALHSVQDPKSSLAALVAVRQLLSFLGLKDYLVPTVNDWLDKYVIPAVKTSPCLEAYTQLRDKLKHTPEPNELPPREADSTLQALWQSITGKNLEDDEDQWTPESLCYQQFNLV